ncbi:MAG: cytochrome c oxidase subunit 3 [Alphaproteobacteria bacterium]
MAETHARPHDYHLVDPSPWPAVGALAALFLAGGGIMLMHDITNWVFYVGILLVFITMFGWWRDVIREAEREGHHTPVVQLGLRYGMALFIASEVMFFAAFFWAFFDASLFPGGVGNEELVGRTEYTGGVWPPESITTFEAFSIPFLNTLILLSSGATVTWAHHEIRSARRGKAILAMWLTILLGISFTSLQAYEYVNAPFTFTGGIYGSTFFMATGFHGFHVIIGTCFLSVCQWRLYMGHFKPDHHFGFEAAAWYWHFVDVVWLFLFSCVYWWGGS